MPPCCFHLVGAPGFPGYKGQKGELGMSGPEGPVGNQGNIELIFYEFLRLLIENAFFQDFRDQLDYVD